MAFIYWLLVFSCSNKIYLCLYFVSSRSTSLASRFFIIKFCYFIQAALFSIFWLRIFFSISEVMALYVNFWQKVYFRFKNYSAFSISSTIFNLSRVRLFLILFYSKYAFLIYFLISLKSSGSTSSSKCLSVMEIWLSFSTKLSHT